MQANEALKRRGRKRKMPRLVRRPRSPYWCVAFYEKLSKRTEYISTKTEDEAEAKAFLDQLMANLPTKFIGDQYMMAA